MKTSYHSKNNKERRRTIIVALVVAVLIFIFIITGFFSSAFYQGMIALSSATSKTSQTANSFSALFSSRVSLESQNQALQSQLDQANADLSDQALLIKENADLKSALHLEQDTGHVDAAVTSKPPFAPFDVITIDAGQNRGVSQGDAVVIGSTYLGSVSSVSNDSSRVTLLSSPSLQTQAYIGDQALPVTFDGKGGGNFEADIPQGSGVKEGDLVFMYAGQNPVFIGTVSKIMQNSDSTLITVLMSLPINLYTLSHVEVVPKK
jgi:rod shape-determining protein MreC